jgi:hypothetical protein
MDVEQIVSALDELTGHIGKIPRLIGVDSQTIVSILKISKLRETILRDAARKRGKKRTLAALNSDPFEASLAKDGGA